MQHANTACIICLVTCSSEAEAEQIASTLVERRLAACGNIIPGLRSIFCWEGSLEREEEVLLLLKSRAELFPQIEAIVTRLHSYDLPEIIAIPIAAGSEAYLRWIGRETGSSLFNIARASV
ncbi:hypothetical protein CSB45_10495 [candidate division KSB3 bacterium]|uniref:Divalent-cation tolerance protein CutA n=1 Tax=candidate division KSB3 bacterium TaxID=2044937 RepID=A0A2G6E3I9_9BACT|nr:MAG: hypothetical protein CSB45_10495 [candidate division KSB3 bacterium]PIE29158.1 MAG: hypothetical protein CSA57_10130 [candidate division KSB3 bacterium]